MTSLETFDPSECYFLTYHSVETAVKINAVANVQGQTKITCSRPNEKQTEALREGTCLSVFHVFVFRRVE